MKRYHFLFLIVFTFACFYLVGCGSRKPLNKIESKQDSAIIAGKIDIFYNGVNVTEYTNILFNEIMWGKYVYKTDTSHILLTELPLGKGHIARLQYENFILNLPKEKSTFVLTDPSKINYLGNIVIDWKGKDFKAPNMFGLAGALADEANPDGIVEIYVDSQLDEIKNYIDEKFGPDHEIISNEIAAAPFDSKAKLNLSKSYNPKRDYYDVTLNDGNEINGKIVSKKNDELYVKNERIIYIVKLNKISNILLKK
jgi:hypothetical protein